MLSYVQTDATMLGVVASICTWLNVWPVSNFAQQLPTTRNNVQLDTQWVTSNNLASVCTGLYIKFKTAKGETGRGEEEKPLFPFCIFPSHHHPLRSRDSFLYPALKSTLLALTWGAYGRGRLLCMQQIIMNRTPYDVFSFFYLVRLTSSKVVIFLSLGWHFPCDTRYSVEQITQQLNRAVPYSPVIIKQSCFQLRKEQFNGGVCVQVHDALTGLQWCISNVFRFICQTLRDKRKVKWISESKQHSWPWANSLLKLIFSVDNFYVLRCVKFTFANK